MTTELVALAARNNAEWCDAVCRANGKGGEFHGALWLNRHGTPRFYPDAVTLIGGEASRESLTLVSATLAAGPERGWALKDSFSDLDLTTLGFSSLFDASWIYRDPIPEQDDHPGVTVRIVHSEAQLTMWSKVWAGEDASIDSIPFRPALLHEPDILFVQVERPGEIIGGGILSKAAGVVGLSNVFTAADVDVVWQTLIGCAGERFPDYPLVGYERGEDLKVACRNGFRSIGNLRVWYRPA